MNAIEEMIDTLNALLRGELSALKTYTRALRQATEGARAEELQRLAAEHREAVTLLRRQIVAQQGTPTTNSGAWGLWAGVVQEVSQLLGSSALDALRQGEAHVLRLYRTALAEGSLPATAAELLRSRLLPRAHAHLLVLDQMLHEEPQAIAAE